MNYKLKKLVLLLASVATVATIGASVAPVTYSVSAATHHKKKHNKKVKHHKKSSQQKNTSSQANNTASTSNNAQQKYQNQLNKDIESYNNSMDGTGFPSYINPDFNYASGQYIVDSSDNSNPNYSHGNYTDISNSLKDIASDMGSNTDSYDNGNSTFGIRNIQTNANLLYVLFRNRFSDQENNQINQLRQNLINDQITEDGSDPTPAAVANQWNNLKAFYSELSNAVSTLNK